MAGDSAPGIPPIDGPLEGGAFGETALIAAIRRGDLGQIDKLLTAGANPNQKSHWWAGGFHPLDGAIDNPSVFDRLVAHGAVPEIHQLARLDRLDEVARLLDAEPDRVHARGGDGQTPLHAAVSIAMAELLLDRGAAIDARDIDHESTPAQYMTRDRHEVLRILIDRGCATDVLMLAAVGDSARLAALLSRSPGAARTTVSLKHFPKRDPRAGGPIYIWTFGWHRTPQSIAQAFAHDAAYRLLMDAAPEDLRRGIALEIGEPRYAAAGSAAPQDPDALARLPFAAMNENAAGVERLLAAGWPAGSRGPDAITALHWAAFHGHLAITRLLLAQGAPLDAVEATYQGRPLDWALHGSLHGWRKTTGSYPAVVEALLAAGAPPPQSGPAATASEAVLAVLSDRR